MGAPGQPVTAAAILEIEGLHVGFRVDGRIVDAVLDAALCIPAGGAVGLVGESGSGKSTFARVLMGLLSARPAILRARRMDVAGVPVDPADEPAVARLRGHTFAMVFQDPLSYLNPLMRAGRQILEAIRLHDDARTNRQARLLELLDLVQLPARVADAYPHELSGGMRQRVLLAIALACRPRLLIADEPTTALDASTQAEILTLLNTLRRDLGMALLLISHDLAAVASLCDTVTVMFAGRTVETAPRRALFADPRHPYTQSLLAAARATLDGNGRFVTLYDGDAAAGVGDAGCAFAGRCGRRMPRCAVEAPPMLLDRYDPRHAARCWLQETAP